MFPILYIIKKENFWNKSGFGFKKKKTESDKYRKVIRVAVAPGLEFVKAKQAWTFITSSTAATERLLSNTRRPASVADQGQHSPAQQRLPPVELMAEIVMCEPWELFNLLNQQRNSVSRLAQSNYLCVFGEKSSNKKTNKQTKCSHDIVSVWMYAWITTSLLPPVSTDAQEIHNYRTSHIITAKNIKQVYDMYMISMGHVINRVAK